MKTIFSKVKLRSGQIVQLFLLVLLSAVGQMLLPSFLAQMISHGVAEGENRIVWMYAVIMAGVTLFSCVISFLSVKIASYISTDFAAQLHSLELRSFLKCRSSRRQRWIGSEQRVLSQEALRILRMYRTF